MRIVKLSVRRSGMRRDILIHHVQARTNRDILNPTCQLTGRSRWRASRRSWRSSSKSTDDLSREPAENLGIEPRAAAVERIGVHRRHADPRVDIDGIERQGAMAALPQVEQPKTVQTPAI